MSVIAANRRQLSTLQPEVLEIADDSAQHAGHAGARSGGGHFRVVIVAEGFAGQTTMVRHRMVYQALGDMMKQEIHAMSIIAKTPTEYQLR